MRILSELRALKKQVAALQANQKEKESIIGVAVVACSGNAITEIDPVQRISGLEWEIEQLYSKLLDAQSKVIKCHEDNY